MRGRRFNLSNPWWIKEIAGRYAHIQMSPFLGAGHYNGTECTPDCLKQSPNMCTCGVNPLKKVAKLLKSFNPKIKVQLYQASDRGELSEFGSRQLRAHPEWWLRDDCVSSNRSCPQPCTHARVCDGLGPSSAG